MKNKLYMVLAFVMMTAMSAWAADSLVEQANKAYSGENYQKALELYLKAEKTQGTASALCYNIGNTYYRLKQTPKAVLYYERALLLDPGNGDARFNLEFVREKAAINEDTGSNYFSARMLGLVSSLSSNTWAVMGIVSFLLLLTAIGAYVFAENVTVRKTGFFGGITLFVVCVIANVCAFYMHGKAVNRNDAIVMIGTVKASTAPRVAKDKSEVAFEAGEGHKVTITDSVMSQGVKWYDVETPGGQHGWIVNKNIERI